MVKSFVAGAIEEKSIWPSVPLGTNTGMLARSLCRKAATASKADTIEEADTGDVTDSVDGGREGCMSIASCNSSNEGSSAVAASWDRHCFLLLEALAEAVDELMVATD